MKHIITIGPSSAVIVDANGRASRLPKKRSATHRARCSCGWRGRECTTDGLARVEGDAHVRLTEGKE